MNTPVHMMAAGSWFGTMPEVSLTHTHAGKKVFIFLLYEFITWVFWDSYYGRPENVFMENVFIDV
jgi:hypothetical protein